jgi:hypothetical protein
MNNEPVDVKALALLAVIIGVALLALLCVRPAKAVETGIYFVISEDADEAKRLEALPVIKAAGIRYIVTYVHENDSDFIAEAKRIGVEVVAERADRDVDGSRLRNVLEAYPSIAWAGTFDDVDGKDNYDPLYVEDINEYIKPFGKPIYMSGGYPNKIANYFNLGEDWIGMQAYPVPFEDASAAWTSYWPAMDTYSGTWAANVQTFAWPGYRAPTPLELKDMAQGALELGASALFFYDYTGAREEGLWEAIEDIVGWLQPEPTPVPTATPTPTPECPCCACLDWLNSQCN